MKLEDFVLLPTMLGMGLIQAAKTAGQEMRHGQDLRRAQGWVDHLALSAQAADVDFHSVVAQLNAARREVAMLRDALEASDEENLDLSLQICALKAVH